MQLTFVPSDARHAEYFYEHRQDPDNIRYNPLMNQNVEALRERLARTSSKIGDWETASEIRWFVSMDDRIVGTVSLQNINKSMLTAEIGYGISTEVRGKGVATAAVRMLTEKAFAETPLRKLIALVAEENLASRRVLNKLGYREEGLLREHFLIQGKPTNEVIFGLLRGELR